MLNSLTKNQKIIFSIILFIMIIIIIYYIYSMLYKDNFTVLHYDNTLIETNLLETNQNILSNKEYFETNFIIVYVCGAVKENKVVKLKENSRICDAIEAVGGFTKEADLININLAYILEDGEKIYVPKKGEEISAKNNYYSNFQNYSSSYEKSNKININTATQTELETVPGIGPSSALKIINYREEHGKFNTIEDIKNVSGIGDAKFKKIKDYISIK